jgi:hypothetical protein
MKIQSTVVRLLLLCCITAGFAIAQAPSDADSTGLPGDNFSLQGALAMFKKAGSPEEFEKLLNSPDNNVNNLDLNGDGKVDYIRVIDKKSGDAHAIVLQVPVSNKENQDIAVIEIEKVGDDSAVVQIVGDEDIFGEETIVEPGDEGADTEGEGNGGDGHGPFVVESTTAFPLMPFVVVNAWGWPGVRFVYAPAYVAWVSPWRWRVYPRWWHPWHPLAWKAFHPFRVRYRAGFAVVRTNRIVAARTVYAPLRSRSVVVRKRYHGPMNHYRVTRTTVRRTPAGVRVKTKVRRGRR